MKRQSSTFVDLLFGIVIPSIILMKFSDADALGPRDALIVALAFPAALGLFELVRFKTTNYIALLGLVSVLLTGGIGLLQLDTQWLAVKEAAIPAVLGIATIASAWIGKPLIRILVYNSGLFDTDKITEALEQRGHLERFNTQLTKSTYLLSSTFFFSAVMNYLLASWIVTSPSGSPAFNEELGQLTLLSYPVIAIPSTVMMLAILYFLWRKTHAMTGLELESVLAPSLSDKD
jgi:hypothetical protein